MAKICKECGVKHRNNATKCVHCGAPFEDVPHYAKKKKLIILVIVCAVLVLAAIASVIYLTGPEAAVRRIMESHKRNDVQAIVDSFPSFLLEAEGVDRDELIADLSSSVESMSEYMFSYSIEKVNDPSDGDREKLIKKTQLVVGDDFNESDIKDIKVVWVKFTGNVPSVWPSGSTRFVMIKYDGRWCWCPYIR